MKWQIGVKSKAVDKHAHVVTYEGRSYYRMYKQSDVDDKGVSNTVPTSAIHPYYPPCTSLYESLSTTALSAYSAELGFKPLPVNGVVTIPAVEQWMQIEFEGEKLFDYAMFKFEKPGNYGGFFTKTIRLLNNNLLFDYLGDHEKLFTIGESDQHTFYTDSGTYCLRYTGKDKIFVIQAQPGAIYTPSPLPPGVTPTPTPTPTAPGGAGLPTGTEFWSNATWPSSGTESLLMWLDSAKFDSLSSTSGIPVNNSPINKWVDRSTNGYELEGNKDRGVDAPQYQPKYKIIGQGINKGPGLQFNRRFRGQSSMLRYAEPGVSNDYQATFIVANTPASFTRGNPEQALVTGATSDGGVQSAQGQMFTVAPFRNHWNAIDINCPGAMCARNSTIYSDTYSGGDGGQYYQTGLAVPDNQSVIPRPLGVLYEGIRTNGLPAYINGLCVGVELSMLRGVEKGWEGMVGEIIILNEQPTDQLRQEIEGYLAWKWGLVPFLPADHPWALQPPYKQDPTPLPPTPEPTETPVAVTPAPTPLPKIEPVGVNVVSPQQLYDTLALRQGYATLWTGGKYESEWEDVERNIRTASSNDTLLNLIKDSNRHIVNTLVTQLKPDITAPWHSAGYDQLDVDCPGSGNTVIRHGYPQDWVDNVKSRLMYCLASIKSGNAAYRDRTLFDILDDDTWRLFTRSVMQPTDDNISAVESLLDTLLLISRPSYSYNHLDIDINMTALYALPGDPTNPPPVSWRNLQGIEFDNRVSRWDVVLDLMFDSNTNLFWQKPVQIQDTTVEITVDLPGLRANQSGFDNTTDLRWKVNVEIGDISAKRAMYSSAIQTLPTTTPDYISNNVQSIHIPSIDGCNFKITPYMGQWPGANTNDIIASANQGFFPKLLCRVDREVII